MNSPVYQIDFTSVDCGKRVASSKRRIRWRFGFTNQDALAAGETGTACRGEEHDITLVWSITSGKRLLLADGQEVHYSNSRAHIFDFTWTMRGNHVLKVIAHSAPPIGAAANGNFRQYDFYVDGQSFFNMPKVYRLGLTGSAAAYPQENAPLALATSSRRTNNYANYSIGGPAPPGITRNKSVIAEIETPHTADEEDAYLAEAIKNSLKDQPTPSSAYRPSPTFNNPSNNGDGDLLDLISEPGPAPAPRAPAYSADMSVGNYTTGSQPSFAKPQLPPSQPSAYNNNYDAFTPAPLPPMPSSTFTPVPTPTSYTPQPQPPAAPTYTSSFTPVAAPVSQPVTSNPVPAPAPTTNSTVKMAPENKGLGNNADDALAKFANMHQLDLVSKTDKSRANPFDDAPAGPAPTLSGMKSNTSNEQPTEKKPIMRSYPPTNTMVVAQNQQGNWGGYGNSYGYGAAPNGAIQSNPSWQQPNSMQGVPPNTSMMMQGQPMMQQGYMGQPPQQQQQYYYQGQGAPTSGGYSNYQQG
jgi:hypothetical protein